jgi:hypothetical protein
MEAISASCACSPWATTTTIYAWDGASNDFIRSFEQELPRDAFRRALQLP